MNYKDSLKSLEEKVLNLYSPLHIYFQSFFLKYHCIFSNNDTYLDIKESLNSPKGMFYSYQAPITLARKNGSDCQNHEINRVSNT
jgi:hypothetical protein